MRPARVTNSSRSSRIKRRLAAYKRPRAVLFVDVLPRTANGKLMRSALKLP
jgi:acetyl-CoA synthetase